MQTKTFITLTFLLISFLIGCKQETATKKSPEMAKILLKAKDYEFNEEDFFKAIRLKKIFDC